MLGGYYAAGQYSVELFNGSLADGRSSAHGGFLPGRGDGSPGTTLIRAKAGSKITGAPETARASAIRSLPAEPAPPRRRHPSAERGRSPSASRAGPAAGRARPGTAAAGGARGRGRPTRR